MKKIMIYGCFLFFLLSSAWNIYYSIISFVASNLGVRESFYFTNDVNQKGTHWGGDNYRLMARKHKLEFVKFKFSDIINSLSKVSSIDPHNSNFNEEYKLISLLSDIGKKPNSYKRETALYIPKTLKVYWNLSCDSHMVPFVAPAITNIAMIEGLPMSKYSCYSHFYNYGYATYHLLGRKAKLNVMNHEQICERAIEEGFVRVIVITEDEIGEIMTETHECTKRQLTFLEEQSTFNASTLN